MQSVSRSASYRVANSCLIARDNGTVLYTFGDEVKRLVDARGSQIFS